MAYQGGDARGHCRLPILAGTPGHPGRHLDLVHSRRFLGRVGRRLGLHPAELHHRLGGRGALRPLGELSAVKAIFYGVSPAVIALILHSCYRLTKLGMTDWLEWALAATAFVITVALRAEVALLFIGCGIVGVLYYGSLFRGRASASSTTSLFAAAPLVAAGAAPAGVGSMLGKLFAFFLKAGSLTFGSGLVIVPFLEKGLVQQTGWLNERDFLVAVAIGMMSPGPVVITATFVGYLVAGFWGSVVATIGIFLPSFLLILIVAPILIRYRGNANVQGFVKGAYA